MPELGLTTNGPMVVVAVGKVKVPLDPPAAKEFEAAFKRAREHAAAYSANFFNGGGDALAFDARQQRSQR